MKILHVAASLDPKWGGPAKVVIELTQALVKKGVEVAIFAPLNKGDESEIIRPKGVELQLFPQSSFARWWTGYSPSLKRAIRKQVTKFDILHIHEIWHHPHFAARQAAKFAGKPFIITVHGALEQWCLDYKAFKKKIYSTLIQRKILKEASALHAITEEEVKNISNFVVNKNIFLIPNGINLEEFEKLPERDWIEGLYPEVKGKKVILFLGRIHPQKGLDILAKAFVTILKKRDDIQLVIAGPDNNGYKNRIVEILKGENAIRNSTFTGMLTGDDKIKALSRADIFVLPSYSEGFSISALEAMACGLPVVITKQCNFPEVEEIGTGKVIEADANNLSEALIELLDNPALCKEMGRKGQRLVTERYTWDKVADEMITAYKTILSNRNVDMEGK